MRWIHWTAGALVAVALVPTAWSFCGFYVAEEPGSLFNESSKVVLVRNGDNTVLTMANDYHGDPLSFGLVVPVPQVIEPGMVTVGQRALIDKLDQYSVPRLAEYHDSDPCPRRTATGQEISQDFIRRIPAGRTYQSASFGRAVQVERAYAVEEFDIQVVRAKSGPFLASWLQHHGYELPPGAADILDSYIRLGMHFFLAKIDLEKQQALQTQWIRPLTVSFRSPKFGLPIRLGTLNASGAQDLLVLVLSQYGRVETTNYRTARLETDVEVPSWVAKEKRFTEVYAKAFEERVRRDGMQAVYLEYAWPLMLPCDPSAGPAPTPGEFLSLGQSWGSQGFLTRLHVRYDAAHFPEDLVFQETRDTTPWQVRYVAHHAYEGAKCPEAEAYYKGVAEREETAEQNLVRLTGAR